MSFGRWPWICAGLVMVVAGSRASAQDPTDPPAEEKVLSLLRSKKIGHHTLGDLDTPEPFLRRVGDRIIQLEYQTVYRAVLAEASASTTMPSMAAAPSTSPAPIAGSPAPTVGSSAPTVDSPTPAIGSPAPATGPQVPLSGPWGRQLLPISGALVVILLAVVFARRWRRRAQGGS